MRWLLPLLLLAGCAVGPYAQTPVYKLPETKAIAARQLQEALNTAQGLSEIDTTTAMLTWHERKRLSDKRTVWLERELKFAAVLGVARPAKSGELYELRIDAAGGQVTFEFKEGTQAAKAEAALRKLASQ